MGARGLMPASGFGFCFPLGCREGYRDGALYRAASWLWQEPGAKRVQSLPGCGCRWQERRVVGWGFFFTICCSWRLEDEAGTLLRPRPSHVPLLRGVQCPGAEEK